MYVLVLLAEGANPLVDEFDACVSGKQLTFVFLNLKFDVQATICYA